MDIRPPPPAMPRSAPASRTATLRRFVLLALAAIIAAWSLAQFAAVRVLVERSYLEFEHEDGLVSAKRLDGFLATEIERLEQIARDWGYWTDTRDFVLGNKPDYAADNLDADTFDNLDVDFVLLADREGQAVYRWLGGGEVDGRVDSALGAVKAALVESRAGHELRAMGRELRGVIGTPRGPMAVVAVPILDNARHLPPTGMLVFGRDVDTEFLADVADHSALAAEIFLPGGASWPSDVAQLWERRRSVDRLSAAPISPAQLGAYVLLHDLDGRPLGVLRSVTQRATKQRFEQMASYVLSISLLLAALLALAVLWVLERRVLSPLASISRVVSGVAREADLELRVPDSGRRDELARLGNEINVMLAEIAAQQQLREARDHALAASAQKSEFLANMSHEIRTPMNGILGMLELVLETDLTTQQQERVRTAYRSAEGLLSLLNDILDFSKLEAGKLVLEAREFDLRELVENLVMLFAPNCEQKGIALSCCIEPGLPRHVGDPLRLQQVLGNLLGNAVKFTTHGEVTIEVIAGATPDHLRITVADTGIGIPAERLSVLFQPFTQVDSSMARRFGGTGLGLAICRQLVERMGGSIEVGSVPGQGTRFTLALRLPAGSGAEAVTHHALTGRRVLVCGPPTGSQRAVTTYLAALGCEVTHALTPAASALGEIDLVVFDEAQAEIVSTALRRQSTASGPARLRLTNFKSSLGERAAVDPREQMISRPVQFHKLQQALARAFSPALPTVPAGDKAVTARAQPLHGARVLLVEDNGVNQALALGMLEAYDVAVSCAESGVEALAQLGTAPFDLVLMDCQMPEMDGLEATRRLRAIEAGSGARRVPIVALTANAMAGYRETCLAARMDAYLAKPFTCAELTEVLRTWLVLPARTVDESQGPSSPGAGSTASRTSTDEFDEGVELSLLS